MFRERKRTVSRTRAINLILFYSALSLSFSLAALLLSLEWSAFRREEEEKNTFPRRCAPEKRAPDEKAPPVRKLESGMVIKVSFGAFNYHSPRTAIPAKPPRYSSTWNLSDIFLHPAILLYSRIFVRAEYEISRSNFGFFFKKTKKILNMQNICIYICFSLKFFYKVESILYK